MIIFVFFFFFFKDMSYVEYKLEEGRSGDQSQGPVGKAGS